MMCDDNNPNESTPESMNPVNQCCCEKIKDSDCHDAMVELVAKIYKSISELQSDPILSETLVKQSLPELLANSIEALLLLEFKI